MFKNCIVFKCRKCESYVFVPIFHGANAKELADAIDKVLNSECRICGEEPEDNWVLYDVSVDP